MTPDRAASIVARAASIVAPGDTMSALDHVRAHAPPRRPRRVGGDRSNSALATPRRGAALGITLDDVAHGCGDAFTTFAAKEGVRA